jgi:hypothetical protein
MPQIIFNPSSLKPDVLLWNESSYLNHLLALVCLSYIGNKKLIGYLVPATNSALKVRCII